MQELYSKVCVAGSIKFVVSKEREEEVDESFSCHLATIFAREQEEYFINISKDAPIPLNTPFLRKFADVIEVRGYTMSSICALVDTTACACNEKYKNQFSNMDVVMLKPVKVPRQPVFSWESVIRKFVRVTREYKKFKKRCLNDHDTLEKLKEIYRTDVTTIHNWTTKKLNNTYIYMWK
ncbi:hypothetical protein RhiirA1_460739 [Rhizophagus irregularis]|uniref:Uncharacterized protein n=2 Tax=Rhizophagus irregularis TaxID=588596 RepID=A0A2I1E9D1_9GLOM|nr:hypothetical protein RhiirA1_460739 [Rhizophagus irregularis]PKY18732.1 hypothetical protein RhiirB3_431606 [Rhizophagus irregularis]